MTAQAETEQRTGVYVYGIIPGDVKLEGTTGIGDPPGRVRLVRCRDLAALVSDVDVDKPLGRPGDLMAHESVLDPTAGSVPVLPLRFGAVVTSDEAVASELLEPHYDEFAQALRELDGHAEYVVRGRYAEDAVLREILAANKQAAALSEDVRGADPDATRDARIRLGELINEAMAAMRERDTRTLGEAVADHVAASVVRQPTHELDAVYSAFLVDSAKVSALGEALQRLARDWDQRVDLRLMGPLAPYDFVATAGPRQEG